jgi:YD repeat-containing protein
MVAAVMVFGQFVPPARASAGSLRTLSRGSTIAAASAHPPQRIAVPEPAHRTPPPMPAISAIRRNRLPATRPVNGRPVPGPPMLRPVDLDRAVSAVRRMSVHKITAAPAASTVRSVRPGPAAPGAHPARGGPRGTMSLPSDPTASGTGINPWWRYSEQNLPGGGHVMVNVGTGNLLLQDDDMAVAHKGIAMAFRRTYNSQSLHDVNGDEGGLFAPTPGMYGNGWTNTFDAHVVRQPGNLYTVYDIDGARYDYTANPPGDGSAGYTSLTPGQHAVFAWDGQCGLTWTKKSGTTYYFYRDNPTVGCPALPNIGGYAGRLYQIIGRNRNTYLTFSYAWDNDDALATGKVSAITVQSESGLTATMSFGDVSGHRLLQQIVFPDGTTSVSYGYDTLGNLTYVSHPPNSSSGVRPVQSFGYYTLGSGSVLQWAASPRWCASTCGTDGAFTAFGFSGANPATSTLSAIWPGGVVNPVIADGTGGGALQSGYSTGAYYYAQENFTTGVGAPTYRDTDGHMTNWVVDGTGRPTQTQECTASAGGSCTGTWLVSNESWDANNNLVSEVDPRGNETDYLYDPMGNTTAVGDPLTTTSQGSFRPTKLYDYDAFNNVIAYCDEKASHANGGQGDWTAAGPPTAGAPDALCANNGSSAHTVFTYPVNPAPAYEPYGELTSIRSPLGYTRTIGYDPSKQGGIDYGLPTSVVGSAIVQTDGSRTPFQTMTYDASGNIICASTDGNDPTTTTLLIYDSLSRVVAVGDPDDASVTNGCAKTAGIAGSAIATRTTYFPNGQVATTTTPAEAAANVSTQFQYDLDGDVTSEQHHFVAGAGPVQKWYDGADRLVEVQQPTDVNDFYTFPWRTRYLYDLTQGGTVTIASSAPYRAYGGLYKTQEQLPSGVTTPQWNEAGSVNGASTGTSNPTWQDTAGTAFDALDRAVTAYRNTGTGLMPVTNTYDGAGSAGLLSQKCNANNECATYSYDPRGAKSQATFNVPSSSTQSFSYDEDGHVAAASNAVGSFSDIYDADGRKTSRQETAGTMSATIRYAYYDDGLRKSLDAVTGTQNLAGALAYTYRPDGLIRQLSVASAYTFSFAYTGGRRLTSRSDNTGQAANILTYTGSGSPTSYGLVQSMTTPGFAETGMTYNAEGGQLGGGYSGANGSPGHLIQAVYTARGEIAVDTSGVGIPSLYANGTRIQTARSTDPTAKTASFSFNALQGMTLATQSASKCAQATCDSSGWVYAYDSIGRQSTAHFVGGNADYINAKSYDAEDHLIAQALPGIPFAKTTYQRSLGYRWGPVGHPLQVGSTSAVSAFNPPPTDFQYDTLVWDDDGLLFTVNSAGQIDDVKVADFADYVPGASNPLTVWDRDTNGQIYGCHTGGAASSVASSGFQQTTVTCGASSSFFGAQFAPNQTPVGRGGMLLIPKSDGFNDGQNTIQGVRTYDPQSGTWTTPDAYRGDVHNPMSQKPFMWNGNNPYEYSDPSGFVPTWDVQWDASWNNAQGFAGSGDDSERTEVAQAAAAETALAAALRAARAGASATEADAASLSGVLRAMAKTKGMYSIGSAETMDAAELGRAWVGPGARLSSTGDALVSSDGTRVFRFPKYKPTWHEKQANFETRTQNGRTGKWKIVSNGHLSIRKAPWWDQFIHI